MEIEYCVTRRLWCVSNSPLCMTLPVDSHYPHKKRKHQPHICTLIVTQFFNKTSAVDERRWTAVDVVSGCPVGAK